MKKKLFLTLLILLTGVAAYVFLEGRNNSLDTEVVEEIDDFVPVTFLPSSTTKTVVSQDGTFELHLPMNWVVTENTADLMELQSPDFRLYPGNLPIKGATVFIRKQEVDSSVSSSKEYIDFRSTLRDSNEVSKRKVIIDGEQGLLTETSVACGMGCDDPDIPAYVIETYHEGVSYDIYYEFEAPASEALIGTIVSSFRFLD